MRRYLLLALVVALLGVGCTHTRHDPMLGFRSDLGGGAVHGHRFATVVVDDQRFNPCLRVTISDGGQSGICRSSLGSEALGSWNFVAADSSPGVLEGVTSREVDAVTVVLRDGTRLGPIQLQKLPASLSARFWFVAIEQGGPNDLKAVLASNAAGRGIATMTCSNPGHGCTYTPP